MSGLASTPSTVYVLGASFADLYLQRGWQKALLCAWNCSQGKEEEVSTGLKIPCLKRYIVSCTMAVLHVRV